MRKPEKTKAKDARSEEGETEDPWMVWFPKDDWFIDTIPKNKVNMRTSWTVGKIY
jgi:hypothetical protein